MVSLSISHSASSMASKHVSKRVSKKPVKFNSASKADQHCGKIKKDGSPGKDGKKNNSKSAAVRIKGWRKRDKKLLRAGLSFLKQSPVFADLTTPNPQAQRPKRMNGKVSTTIQDDSVYMCSQFFNQ